MNTRSRRAPACSAAGASTRARARPPSTRIDRQPQRHADERARLGAGRLDLTPPAAPARPRRHRRQRRRLPRLDREHRARPRGLQRLPRTGPAVTRAPRSTAPRCTSPAYTDTAAVNGTTYYYAVTAVDTAATSPACRARPARHRAAAAGACGLDLGSARPTSPSATRPSSTWPRSRIEIWFKRTGAGDDQHHRQPAASPALIPLVTKGRAEADGSNVDTNWFLGIDDATDTHRRRLRGHRPTGLNHPVLGHDGHHQRRVAPRRGHLRRHDLAALPRRQPRGDPGRPTPHRASTPSSTPASAR